MRGVAGGAGHDVLAGVRLRSTLREWQGVTLVADRFRILIRPAFHACELVVHVHPVGRAAGLQERHVTAGALARHEVTGVARRAQARVPRAPVLFGIILGRALIHLPDRDRVTVHDGSDEAIVRAAVRVVAARTRQLAHGQVGRRPAVGAIAPRRRRRAVGIVDGGDGLALIVRKAAAQQRGIVGGIGLADVTATVGMVRAILHIGVRAPSRRAVARHAQGALGSERQQTRSLGRVRAMTAGARVGSRRVFAVRAAVSPSRRDELRHQRHKCCR